MIKYIFFLLILILIYSLFYEETSFYTLRFSKVVSIKKEKHEFLFKEKKNIHACLLKSKLSEIEVEILYSPFLDQKNINFTPRNSVFEDCFNKIWIKSVSEKIIHRPLRFKAKFILE